MSPLTGVVINLVCLMFAGGGFFVLVGRMSNGVGLECEGYRAEYNVLGRACLALAVVALVCLLRPNFLDYLESLRFPLSWGAGSLIWFAASLAKVRARNCLKRPGGFIK